MNLPIIAAFDFDGTITRTDSMIPFLNHVCGSAGLTLGILRCMPALVSYAFGRKNRQGVKETLFLKTLGGQPVEVLAQAAAGFVETKLSSLVRQEALERIAWHKNKGHRLVLVSASLDLYLQPWAEANGFDTVLASKLEVVDGRITGRLRGLNCRGQEKVQRLQEILPDRASYTLYVYGDSSGDAELLAYGDHTFYRRLS